MIMNEERVTIQFKFIKLLAQMLTFNHNKTNFSDLISLKLYYLMINFMIIWDKKVTIFDKIMILNVLINLWILIRLLFFPLVAIFLSCNHFS